MILTYPIIYLEKGKSVYTISGLPEFNKLDNYFKENPLNLAKLFREENNKTIVISIDNSIESILELEKIINSLDIPIQVLILNRLDKSLEIKLKEINFKRLFSNCFEDYSNTIPVYKYSKIDSLDGIKKERILLDFEENKLTPINIPTNLKISVINSKCDTNDLIKLNTNKSNIDSVLIGKDYYGTHFAGQTLWRIAEKQQFCI